MTTSRTGASGAAVSVLIREDDPPLLRGVGGAFLESLPVELVERLSEGAVLMDLTAGEDVFGDSLVRTGIVASGTVRTYLRSSDGRQMTVRYARRGALVGTLTGNARELARVRVQAVTAAEVIELDRPILAELIEADTAVGRAVIDEVGRRLQDMYAALAADAFGTVRERVIRHLLELAEEDPEGGVVRAPTTQQALADSIGSAREVVGRTLAALRAEGLIETLKGRIVLLDQRRLALSAGWSDR